MAEEKEIASEVSSANVPSGSLNMGGSYSAATSCSTDSAEYWLQARSYMGRRALSLGLGDDKGVEKKGSARMEGLGERLTSECQDNSSSPVNTPYLLVIP